MKIGWQYFHNKEQFCRSSNHNMYILCNLEHQPMEKISDNKVYLKFGDNFSLSFFLQSIKNTQYELNKNNILWNKSLDHHDYFPNC